jgi:hypothetical protein
MPEMGFRLARSMGMEGSTGNLHEFPIDPTNTTAIFRGDLVTLSGGYVEGVAGAAGDQVLGIFWGCRYVDDEGGITFKKTWNGVAGSSDIQAHVSVMPAGATMLVAVDPTEVYTAADVGTKKPAAAGSGGNALNGQSSMILGAAGATVATAPLVVLGFLDANFNKVIPAAAGDAVWAEVAVASANSVGMAGA